MSDEQQSETVKKRGRPSSRKKPPPPRREPHSDEDFYDQRYQFFLYEARDKFYIPKEITDAIARDWEQALQWMALEIAGQPNEFLSSFRQNQWEEVRAGDFEGQFDHFGIKDGIICVNRVALFRQPIQIKRKALAYDKRMADAPKQEMRRKPCS